jgi:CDP-diglyceride synthetase
MLDTPPRIADFGALMLLYAGCLAAGFGLKGLARKPGSDTAPNPTTHSAGLPKGPGIARKFKVFFLFQSAMMTLAFWSLPGLAFFFLILFGCSAWEIAALNRRATYPVGYGFRPVPAYGLLSLFGLSLACHLAFAAQQSGNRLPSGGFPFLAFVFLLIAVADGYAQITGQIFGGPKIAPRISPGKTWSGFLGGMGFCALAAWIGNRTVFGFLPDAWAALSGLAVGGLAFLGDISASWVKRRMGIKDFSNLLGPQGGVLDRGDSLIWLGPALWMAGMALRALQGAPAAASNF